MKIQIHKTPTSLIREPSDCKEPSAEEEPSADKETS